MVVGGDLGGATGMYGGPGGWRSIRHAGLGRRGSDRHSWPRRGRSGVTGIMGSGVGEHRHSGLRRRRRRVRRAGGGRGLCVVVLEQQ